MTSHHITKVRIVKNPSLLYSLCNCTGARRIHIINQWWSHCIMEDGCTSWSSHCIATNNVLKGVLSWYDSTNRFFPLPQISVTHKFGGKIFLWLLINSVILKQWYVSHMQKTILLKLKHKDSKYATKIIVNSRKTLHNGSASLSALKAYNAMR